MGPFHLRLLLALAAFTFPATAFSAPDEIQVYTGDLVEPGERGIEIHSNLVRDRVRTPEYAGAQPAARIFRLTPESSFRVAKNWDAGFYVPIMGFGHGRTDLPRQTRTEADCERSVSTGEVRAIIRI